MYEGLLIKKVRFNGHDFTIITELGSSYDNEQWHHMSIVYRNVTLVKLQSPSRKLLYEALKRSLLVCIAVTSAPYAIIWPETIWVNMDIPGKHEAWRKEQDDNMAIRQAEIEAEQKAIPHYKPSIADIISNNQSNIEYALNQVFLNQLNIFAQMTERDLDKSMYFAIKNIDTRNHKSSILMEQSIYYWLRENGYFDNPSFEAKDV